MSMSMEKFDNQPEPQLNLIAGELKETDTQSAFILRPAVDFVPADEIEYVSSIPAFDSQMKRQSELVENMAGMVTSLKENLYQKLPVHPQERQEAIAQNNRTSVFLLLAVIGACDSTPEEEEKFLKAYSECETIAHNSNLDKISDLMDKHENHPIMAGLRMLESSVLPMVEVRKTVLVMLERHTA